MNIEKEFGRMQKKIESVDQILEGENSKQYDFVHYLIDVSRDLSYLEYAITHSANLINAKDLNGVHIFRKVIENIVIHENDEDKELSEYYKNVLSLFLSKDKLYLSEKDKRTTLGELYRYISELSKSKKDVKQNKELIEYLNGLIETVKNLNKRKTDIETLSQRYKINIYFDDDVLEQAKLSKKQMSGKFVNRTEIGDYVISIDKESTSVIDDCLSCIRLENGNYLLGVHIASVLAHFPYESEIVQNAIERSRAIYLRKGFENKDGAYQKTIPIYPYEFASDSGSLKEGEKRLARSYYFEITPTGEVVNEVFYKSIVKNDKKTSYREVDKMFKDGLPEGPLGETLKNLKEVTDILSKKNSISHIYEQKKENVEDTTDLRVKNTGAGNIVYQATLLTESRVAEFFARNNYPFIYRVHEINEENALKLQAMVEELDRAYGGQKFENLYQLIAGVYPTGWYATEGKHVGLGKEHHCHITSGLWRGPDTVAEHCLEVCYDKTPTDEELEVLREELEDKILIINSKQKTIEWFVKEYKKTKPKR